MPDRGLWSANTDGKGMLDLTENDSLGFFLSLGRHAARVQMELHADHSLPPPPTPPPALGPNFIPVSHSPSSEPQVSLLRAARSALPAHSFSEA